jgi:hypothetical protein
MPSQYRLDGELHDCDCAQQLELYRHYLLANIPDTYMRLCADDFIGDEDAWHEIEVYLENWQGFKQHGIGLGFHSQIQGTGKTFLATYIARELVKRKESVYYIDFKDVMTLFLEPQDIRQRLEGRLRYDTVVVIDEIPKSISAAQKELFAEKLESIIRFRTNYNRVTIFTTNLEPSDMNEEYSRVFSLLSEKEHQVPVKTGKDVRTELKTKELDMAMNLEVRPIS